MLTRALGIIPARYGSTRFHGKLLKDLCGKSVIVRTVESALQSKKLNDLWLATDNYEILETVNRQCPMVKAIMTSINCPSGSDRIVEALNNEELFLDELGDGFPYDVIVNVQGDEPLLNPNHIDMLVDSLANEAEADIATLVFPISKESSNDSNIVKCAFGKDGRALYFSRSPIPHGGPYFKHVGLYAYRPKALIKFVKALPSKLEKIESLEQLRAMEIGLSIHVVEVETANHGIDTPEQLEMARKLLKKL
jgi:3-deoxy-manno-octulosonate cytidylyltransferase (CMP-KDO synthetase)